MFGKKKNTQGFELEEKYIHALRQCQVPLLTLDPRWHQLFPDYRKTKKLKKLEKNLNRLIKKQGQTNNDIKEYEKAKKVLLENILNNMTDGSDLDSPIRSKKQDKNQQLLEELEYKMREAGLAREQLPLQISRANQELLIESMRICYGTMLANTERIEQEDIWVTNAREILKEHLLVKQELEMQNTDTYRFMHDLLGAKVLEIFDRDYAVWKGEREDT